MGRRAVAAVVAVWVVVVSSIVDRIVPEPYMDEIFHIPQARKYCAGDFRSWDPMITTPPGMYFLSIVPIAALFTESSLKLSAICSTSFLRATNGFLSIICSILIYDILILLRPKIGNRKATIYAIFVALYPVHWFFSFLYYSDVPSMAAVLAMLLASLKGRYWISSAFAAISVSIRQTNIIWMLFIAFNAGLDLIEVSSPKDHASSDDPWMDSGVVINGNIRIKSKSELRRRAQQSKRSVDFSTHKSGRNSSKFYSVIQRVWHLKWRLLISFFSFGLVLSGFMAFVVLNGGIVLGAKEDHVISIHFAQIVYFGLICGAATAPLHFSPTRFRSLVKSFLKMRTLGVILLAFGLVLGFISLLKFTSALEYFILKNDLILVLIFFCICGQCSIIHPYLLADNRHYAFYFRKDIIQGRRSIKYLMIPPSLYSWFSISRILGKSRGKIWALTFFLACSATLVPAPLVEFRYFTVPIILLLLNSRFHEKKFSLALNLAIFVAVDVFTMWMFLFRPFEWPHQQGVLQRFIW